MWEQLERIIKPDGAIVLFGSQPFTTILIYSNIDMFKYEIIYEKTNPKGFYNSKHRPMTSHENILVFSKSKTTFNPQKWKIPESLRTKRKTLTSKNAGECYGNRIIQRKLDDGTRNPTSVVCFSNHIGRNENYHPTMKPVLLMEYLINTYTNENETVLDFTMGSGSTGIGCLNTNRKFIGIEMDDKYFEIASNRINNHKKELNLNEIF